MSQVFFGARRAVQRPLVIAHRGSSHDEPEHTLKAYRRAIGEGADAVECDVRLTADGHLVCVHDRRINRTSDGDGVVSALELATLEGLDWGSWKSAHRDDAEVPDRDRKLLLTLRRLLTMVVDCGRDVGLNIETKHPTRYAGQVEQQLVRVLREFDLDGPYRPGRPYVQVMSFSQMATARMRSLAPAIPLVYLMGASVPLRMREGALPRGVQVVGIDTTIMRQWPQTVERQQRRGHRVYVYTVDNAEDLELALALNLDGIITKRPAFVRRALAVSG